MQGILPALITPLTTKGEIAEDALEQLLAMLYGAGVHGVYIAGNTGEGLRLDAARRERLLELVVKYSPQGKLLIAHVGAQKVDEAIRLARHAEKTGAVAISSLPPAGDFESIRHYYTALAQATELPLLVYYFPEVAPSVSTFAQIEQLCALPRVIGLKFTDFDFFRMSRLCRRGETVFNGRDEALVAGLLMGAHGGIGSFYNVAPKLVLEIYGHANRGQWAEARHLQDRFNDLIATTIDFPMIPALKSILRWCGIDCGPALGPVAFLTAEQEQEFRKRLEAVAFEFPAALQVA